MNSKKVIKILEKEGWKLINIKGSHHQYKHALRKGRVTVPHPKKDLPKATLYSIFKQAKIDKSQYE